MPRRKRGPAGGVQINIENHPYNSFIIPQLQVKLWERNFTADNMPWKQLLDEPVHGWTHALHMLVYASLLCDHSAFDMEVVRWTILTHDSGRYTDHEQESLHPQYSAYIVRSMFSKARGAGSPVDVDGEKVINIVGRHNLVDDSQSTEEAVLRTADRLDLYRMPGFAGLNQDLMHAPGWREVEKTAKKARLEGQL